MGHCDYGMVLQEHQLLPSRVTQMLLGLYHSHLTALNLLWDWMTRQWDYGTVLQECQLPPLWVTQILLCLYHSHLTATFKGDIQSIYSLSHSALISPFASMSASTIFRFWDSDTDSSFDTDTDWFLSSKVLSISQCESIKDPSRSYFIQGTIINNSPVPLLWLPVNTADVFEKAFSRKAVAFGCMDGQVIILDLSQLNLHETVIV